VVGPARERSPPQPGRLCLLTSYRPAGDESSSDEPIGLLRWDRQESDVGSGQDVDALFGPLWEAAGLPSLPTYTEAGAQTVNPPAEEAEVQAVPATSDVGLHLIPVPTRTVGLYTAGTSWADTLLRGMSVADVVQTITERLGESVPSIVARLAREGVSHNLQGFSSAVLPGGNGGAHSADSSSGGVWSNSGQHPATKQPCTPPFAYWGRR